MLHSMIHTYTYDTHCHWRVTGSFWNFTDNSKSISSMYGYNYAVTVRVAEVLVIANW